MKPVSFNILRFPTYLVLIRLDFWMPIFFLFFLQRFPLEKALQLEAIYYAAVVLLEVPSGYFSDRFGRKLTLIASSTAGAFSGMIFATCQSFEAFAAAQVLYAVFMSFNSGSDTSLLYDSLKAEGREKEMLEIEANAHSKAFFFGAIASAVAGIAAYYGGYRAVYALSGLAYAAAALLLCRFTEPPITGKAPEKTMLAQIGVCVGAMRERVLLWIFVFYVGRTIFEHIPYEFFQPYLSFIVSHKWIAVASGFHLALTKFVSSYVAKRAAKAAGRWGTAKVLLFVNGATTGMILLMGLWVHWIVVVLLLGRQIAHSLGQTVMNAAIHPRIESGMRATYLSLQSLTGRLAFSVTLASLSWWAGEGADAEPQTLSKMLLAMAVFGAAWFAGLFWTVPSELDKKHSPAPKN
jgi:MFS family permease